MRDQLKHISKLMSLVLRHEPEKIELKLDDNGWASVKELIEKINKNGIKLNEEILDNLVANNDKKRFAFNDDKTKIRASQGHSIDVDLDVTVVTPPNVLYHGTTSKFLESILANGVKKQSRQHVHLSATVETANTVGSRHGKPALLIIDAKAMHDADYKFYISENKVWLTDEVPPQFIKK